jgi:hypothetical protein
MGAEWKVKIQERTSNPRDTVNSLFPVGGSLGLVQLPNIHLASPSGPYNFLKFFSQTIFFKLGHTKKKRGSHFEKMRGRQN